MSAIDRPWSPVEAVRRRWTASNRALAFNAGSIVLATAATSALGLLYWGLAARQFPPAALGLASAAIAAMTLIGTVAVLGLGTLLIGELPRQPGRAPALILTALLVVASAGAAFGVLFALFAPTLAADLGPLAEGAVSIVLFAVGTALTAVTLVLDQALIGLLRGGLQLGRNVIFAVAKLAALLGAAVWLADGRGMTIYLTWVLGNALSLAVLAGLVLITRPPGGPWWPRWRALHGLGWEALKHHLLNVALMLAGLALPLIVTATLSATMTAYFYTASMMTMIAVMAPVALTTLLYRMGAADPPALGRLARLTLGLSLLSAGAAAAVLLVGADQLLGLLGPSYVEHAAWPLRILALGVFPMIVREHFVAIARVRGRLGAAVAPVVVGTALTLGGGALGALAGGLVGLCLGVVAGLCCEALYMAPTVYRVAAPGRPAGPQDA